MGAMTITIDQRFETYTGTLAEIKAAINQDLIRVDNWFIRQIESVQSGAGIAVWVLWERQTKPI